MGGGVQLRPVSTGGQEGGRMLVPFRDATGLTGFSEDANVSPPALISAVDWECHASR